MVAGLNCKIRAWRMVELTDDTIGGARVSGTSYVDYEARIQGNKQEQLLVQQGLETLRTFTCLFAPGNRVVDERDEIEVVAPFDHVYFGHRFRIIGMTHSDHNPRDPRNYTMLTLARSERAHNVQ